MLTSFPTEIFTINTKLPVMTMFASKVVTAAIKFIPSEAQPDDH